MMKTPGKIFLAIASIFSSLTLIQTVRAVPASQLNLEIEGITNPRGNICFTIFSRSDGFPRDGTKALKAECSPIENLPVTLSIDGLNAGNYAVAVFHDENADGQLNTNAVGIPQEGFGFSNNPPILTGAPKFSEATFFVAGQTTTVRITMKYLLRI
ncbi:DUF2141 domain-containing protein [Oscillatoria acuminata]|nr:DUF2141 domain-containing protein [Oscillatoria acuminata]